MLSKGASRLWVLAINSTRARVLRGIGSDDDSLPVELILKSEARRLRQIMSDVAVREVASTSTGKCSTIEYGSKTIDEDQRDFIRQVFALLESHRCAGEFDHLAIFAELRVLGVLSQMMPQALRGMVICAVPKNLLHLSPRDLPKVILEDLHHGWKRI